MTLAIGEGLLDCYALGSHLAYGNRTRGYQFAVFPGIHAQDLSYTFFVEAQSTDSLGVPIAVEAAKTMQDWVVDFAMLGPDGPGSAAAQLPVFGEGASVVNVTGFGFDVVKDPAANSRCRFWLDLTP